VTVNNNRSREIEEWISGYAERLRNRYSTFLKCLQICNQSPLIVETGTVRHCQEWGSNGQSTFLFGEFVSKFGGKLITVDINKDAIELSRKVTSKFQDSIEYVQMDSVEFLMNHKGRIDLLYLDSMDCPTTGNALQSQKHNLAEFIASMGNLNTGSVVLLDDAEFENGGKTGLTEFVMPIAGFECVQKNYQSLWIKK